jgi:hypothetical protein
MVANLTLRRRPLSRGFPLAWDNVLYDSPSLGYVVATHQSGRDHGATVFTYYLPVLDDDAPRGRTRLLATTWEEWALRILADLTPAHPDIRDAVERIDVYLWGHAMVRPQPGSLWSRELSRAADPIGPIYFGHTDLSGMALFEEAQYWGMIKKRGSNVLDALANVKNCGSSEQKQRKTQKIPSTKTSFLLIFDTKNSLFEYRPFVEGIVRMCGSTDEFVERQNTSRFYNNLAVLKTNRDEGTTNGG